MKKTVPLLAAACSLALTAGAYAGDVSVELSFHRITSNNVTSVGSQLHCTVHAATLASNYVEFTFTNVIGIQSNVSEIYFDDGTLLGTPTITNIGGTTFVSSPINPGALPGSSGATPPFITSVGFSADSGTGHGIDSASRSVTLRFALQGSQTFANTLAALSTPAYLPGPGDPPDHSSLRVGLHVRSVNPTGIGDNTSDSYVNNTLMTVPLPPAAYAGLGTLGCVIGLGYIRRRRHMA
jgi:hypothetical protein